jgi:hypothetical protein
MSPGHDPLCVWLGTGVQPVLSRTVLTLPALNCTYLTSAETGRLGSPLPRSNGGCPGSTPCEVRHQWKHPLASLDLLLTFMK